MNQNGPWICCTFMYRVERTTIILTIDVGHKHIVLLYHDVVSYIRTYRVVYSVAPKLPPPATSPYQYITTANNVP